MATSKPNPIYIAVIFQPNKENNIAIAISLFKGADIKNEKVTPKGILACKNPKKEELHYKYKKE